MKITKLDNKKKEASIEILDSSIAFEKLKKGKSKETVCTINEGVLAGIFSHIFGKDVDCVEKSCLAKGDEFCIYVIQ